MRSPPHVFAVANGLPFLTEAVKALLDNRLIRGIDMNDPVVCADTRIYVPSKQVAGALRSAFVDVSPHKTAFLPNILPLGEQEYNDFTLFAETFNGGNSVDSSGQATEILSDPAVLAPLEKQLLLARLIRPWRERLPQHIRDLFGREAVDTPADTADALWLARSLALLMDELTAEKVDPKKIAALAPENLAEWWQITIEFLSCVFDAWSQILAELCVTDAADKRNMLLQRAAKHLRETATAATMPLFSAEKLKNRPVLVFGSEGSLPAVADFIKTVAYLPQGAVVLPALDRDLEKTAWENLDNNPRNAAAFAHPQFALKRLLQKLNVKRESVIFLGQSSLAQRKREKWISEIFRPAESTDAWRNFIAAQPDKVAAAEEYLNKITVIEASGTREEALAIAVCLREALQKKERRAALVTGDRTLARRVCGELARFGIAANDSGGTPLAESEPVMLIRLLLSCIFTPGDAVALLALLKHPLTRLGFNRADLRRQSEQFEFFALRGGTGRIALAKATEFMEQRLQKLTETESISSLFTAERMDESLRLAALLETAAVPLYKLSLRPDKITLQEALAATIETLENFGRDDQQSLHRLYADAAGQKLIAFCRAVLTSHTLLPFPPAEWPRVLEALLADETVAMQQNGHARLAVLGLFEARLQHFDTVIIGGLNEGSLPHNPQNSPFLSRTMKAAIHLPPPEQKIGFSAHDIMQLFAMPNVILTRAMRVENTPSIASRWLQRLRAVTDKQAFSAMQARGQYYLALAQKLDFDKALPFAARPNPKPPVSLRPKSFSVTEIETLRRDPYAVYAKRILNLRQLEPIIRDEDVAERGTLYHAILAAFSGSYPTANIAAIPAQAEKMLHSLAREEFAKLQLPPDIEVLWWPRFCALIPHYLQWEAGLSQRRRYSEILAQPVIVGSSGCTLRGRADRIDILAEKDENGNVCADIIDFKTGSNPSKKQAQILAAPQLALEAALLKRSAFKECGPAMPENIFYIRLKAGGAIQAENIAQTGSQAVSADVLCEKAWQQLENLLRHFQKPSSGYCSKALPPLNGRAGDYDHLARVFEWSNLTGEAE